MSTIAERRSRVPLLIAASTVVLALPLIAALVALADRRWYPVLDLAMTEFRIRDVGGRQTPLIGLPGRIGTLPEQGSHPGPLSFWALAPGYRLFGSSAWAMEAATVTVQLVWISLALWIGHRRLGLVGVATVAAVIAVLVRGFGLTVLVQPWNPYLPLLAWLVVLLSTWAVLCGDHLMIVPLVAASSFAAQTHIPYLLMAGGLGLLAVAVVAFRWWQARPETGRPPPPRAIVVAAIAFVGLWSAPFVDQLRRTPGNISRLLDHFGSPPEEAIGFTSGLRLLLRHLDIVGGFFELLTDDAAFLDAGFQPDGAIWPGAIVLVAWIGSVVVALRLGHGPLVRLHALLGLTLVLSWLSMSRIFGQRWFYLTLWAWVTTTLLVVSVVWTAIAWWRSSHPERSEIVAPMRLAAVGSGLAMMATLSMVIAAPSADHPEEYLGDRLGALVDPTLDSIERGVGAASGRDGTYVVEWDDAYFFGSQAFGLVNELERAGLDVGTYDFWRVPITNSRVIAPERATAEIVFVTGVFVETWRADDRVVEVASIEPRSADELVEFAELRDTLIAELAADGLDDLVPLVDTNLFGLQIDQRISETARLAGARMIELGEETAVFIGPPGVTR